MSKPLYNITTDDGSDLELIDQRTVTERHISSETAHIIGHTQVWQWDNGDAIVVITNRIGEPCSAVIVIRAGDEIRAIPCGGLDQAMRCMGLDPKEHKVSLTN
jgi:hypothetical protein